MAVRQVIQVSKRVTVALFPCIRVGYCRRSRYCLPEAVVDVVSACSRHFVTVTSTFPAAQLTTTTSEHSFCTSARNILLTPTGTSRALATESTASFCSSSRVCRIAVVHTTSYLDSISSSPARRPPSTLPRDRPGAYSENC